MSRARRPYDRALAFARRHGMFRPGDRVLVGLAGPTSLGLLAFLLAAQRALGLAEVAGAAIELDDETTDAAEAVADVGRVVRQLGLTFYAVRPSPRERARGGARRELLALAQTHGYHRVALAHTRDDDALRVLGQIVRGGGIDAVTGLAPRLTGGVVRPLLALTEAEALSLARGVPTLPALPPAEEPGQRPATLDAALRGAVLPRLRALGPGVDASLARLGREARARRRHLRAEAAARVTAGRRGDGAIELAAVPGDVALARAVARAALAALGLARAETVKHAARLADALGRAAEGGANQQPLLVAGVVATYVPARRLMVVRAPGVARPSHSGARG